MNYPVWDVGFGAGLLIAIVSIVHVFISHFAVGGGLYLVLTERKAYRDKDDALLKWLQAHSKFFVLVTVVAGAVTGVGIWFTIGLIHPTGTSSLIHAYVWGWAIEWIFFFIEITAALLYLYGWQKLSRKTHLWLGWIYFIAAFFSLVIINGILTFMLTPGRWVETHQFWHGFFNPTYFPSLFIRAVFAMALAGIYALLTTVGDRNEELKARLVRWSAAWILPAFILLPPLAWWYIGQLPSSVWASALGKMPTASLFAQVLLFAYGVTLVFSALALIRPGKMNWTHALIVFLAAFTVIGSFEFIREAIRKPYVVYDVVYSNSIFKQPMDHDGGMNLANLKQAGLLPTARWSVIKEVTEENRLQAGAEVFRLECLSCHTLNAYRGVTGLIRERGWDETGLYNMINSLDKIANGTMPPFAGTDAERQALAAFLAQQAGAPHKSAAGEQSGEEVFSSRCGACHEAQAGNILFVTLQKFDEERAAYLITKVDSLNENMPPFEGSEAEAKTLAKWIKTVK